MANIAKQVINIIRNIVITVLKKTIVISPNVWTK